MASFFTDHFRAALRSNQAIMDPNQAIKLVLFRYAPAMGTPNPVWTKADTVAELIATNPGWAEVSGVEGYPLSLTFVPGVRVVGTAPHQSKYVMINNPYSFSELKQTAEVRAIGVVFVGTLDGVINPLIFVTSTPIDGVTNIAPGDSLTASPNLTIGPTVNQSLFGWSVASPDPVEGPLVFFRGAPQFEMSGSQHAWLYPQRANMIANPSFERPGTEYWSGNAALTRIAGGAPGTGISIMGELEDPSDLPPAGADVGDKWLIDGEIWDWSGTAWVNIGELPHGVSAWSGSCAGNAGYAIMESNIFPTALGELDSEQWTIQVMAKGSGRLKVGLVYWDTDYRVTGVDWGEDEEWALQTNAWIHVATHRRAPEGHIALVRLEVRGEQLTIDRVLAERGYLKDWAYFDGDERFGALDDFSWYGGINRQGQSYSLWYNNRKAVVGRLFARSIDPNDPTQNVTDEEMEEQGLVYRWVPAGITVIPHLDVFYPGDVQNPVSPKAGGVLPYLSPSNPDGVLFPWGVLPTPILPPTIPTPASAVSSTTSQLPAIPLTGVTEESLFLVAIGNQDSAAPSDYTNNQGMVRVGAPFVANTPALRVAGIWIKGFPEGSPPPQTVQFTRPGTGLRQIGIGINVEGVDLVKPVDVASTGFYTAGPANAGTAPGLTSTVDNGLAIAVIASTWAANIDATVTSATLGWTLVKRYYNPDPDIVTVSRNYVSVYSKPVNFGPVGDFVITWAGAPAQKTGQMIVLRPVGAPETPKTWTITEWRATSNPAIAHRGAPNGTTRSEFSHAAYQNAISKGFVALEASVHRSSDGVWFLNHDATTGNQYTTNVTINTQTAAQLEGLTRKVGAPEPMMRLTAFLSTYSRFVMFIENKSYANFAEFEALLNAADLGRTRIVAKHSGNSTSTHVYFKDRGYTTWGYFFGTAGAATLPDEWGTYMTWVGMSAGPTNNATAQTWWDWCRDRSIPVVGHIVNQQADFSAMKTQGALMYMTNNDTLFPLL